MSIALVITDRNAEKLQKLLQERLPNEEIELWPNIQRPEKVTFAVMWKHPRDIWQQLPNLKVAQSLGAGVDHFTYDNEIPSHILLSRIVDQSLADQMAEYVLAVVLMRKCRLSVFTRQQSDKNWKFQRRLQGNQVLVLGVGKIGDVVANKLIENGLDVTGWSRSEKLDKAYPCYFGKEALFEQLGDADYVINLLPDTPETTHLINQPFLTACKKESWLINVGRGNTVDENALATACREYDIAGATLDVFQQEPLPKSHRFWQIENIDITPHIAAITDQKQIIEQVALNYLAMTKSEEIANLVDKVQGY